MNNFLLGLHMALCKFFLYCIVLYCIIGTTWIQLQRQSQNLAETLLRFAAVIAAAANDYRVLHRRD